MSALPIDVTSLAFGVGHLYQFGLPLLMRYPDRVVAMFPDIRRSGGLSIEGREWVFSAMHARFRAAYPDLQSIDLEIWRYRNDAERTLVALHCEDVRFSFDNIVADVRETYEIYGRVLNGERDRRRQAGGGSGTLL